jgi:SAM-dependent methyltransferase
MTKPTDPVADTLHAADRSLTTTGGAHCPVCGGSAAPSADAGGFRLYACPGCHCWSSDALARGATASFTPNAYFENAASDKARWTALLDRVSQHDLAVRSVLDVGCGTGAFLAYLRAQMPSAAVAGIELDAGRAGHARAAAPGATIHCGDAVAVAESLNDTFDLITLWDLLEHVPDPRRLVRALAARLAPGGALFIQTIHEDSLLPRLGRLSYRLTGGRFRAGIRRTHDAHHLVFFSLTGLDRLAGQAGLRVTERWFGRLAHARMDGNPLLTVPASVLMAAENFWGNGLFVNLLLSRDAGAALT